MSQQPIEKVDLCCFGQTTADHIFHIRSYSKMSKYGYADRHLKLFGGKAANTAVAASRNGAKVAACLQLGADYKEIGYKAYLESEGIRIDEKYQIFSNNPTPHFYCIFDSEKEISFGEKVCGELADVNQIIARCAQMSQEIESNIIFCGFSDSNINWHIIRDAKARRNCFAATTIMDDVEKWETSKLAEYLLDVDILFMNQDEADYISQKLGKNWMMKQLRSNRMVLITHGSLGATLRRGAQQLKISDEARGSVSNPVGAGDAFAGAFLSSIARGDEAFDAVRTANWRAGCHVSSSLQYPSLAF